MINNRFKNLLIFPLVAWQIASLSLPVITYAQDSNNSEEIVPGPDFVDTKDYNPSADPTPYNTNLPDTEQITSGFDSVQKLSESDLKGPGSPSQTAARQFPSEKIVLNPVDRRKLEQMGTLANALPDFYDDTNLNELSALSGTSYDQLVSLKTSDPGKFSQLITAADGKTHNNDYLMNKIKKDPVILAELFNTTTDEMVYELQNDPKGVEKAIQRVMDTQIDKRVIKTLVYLITPKDQGGAGHWRIKVERITKNYDKEPSKFEREDKAIKEQITLKDNPNLSNTTVEQVKADKNTTAAEEEKKLGNQATAVVDIVNKQNKSTATAYIGNTSDEDNNTVSSHFSGQAVDISEVDDIKCTVVGHKRIGNDSKTAQAPRPIKLSWQTQEGYAKDKSQIDSSYNSMFLNASQGSILEMLSQLNFDFASISDMKGANFSDMAGVLAQAFLMNAINAPNGNIWKFNLTDTLRSLGGVILADELELNRMPFLDSSINSVDALSEAIGRSYIEENLNLPYGALKGANRDELLSSIGKQRILSELSLPDDTLNNEIKDSADLYQRIGSRIVESEFGFQTGSFYGKGNFGDISKVAGKYKLEALRGSSSGADENLGLPAGTFSKFASGTISPADFNRLVAEARFTSIVQLYGNSKNNSSATPTIDLPSGKVSNLRDEVFNLPKGKIDRFLNGELNVNDYKEIGIYSVSQILETNDSGRSRITTWFNSPTKDMTVAASVADPNNPGQQITQSITLPSLDYAGTMGVENQDFYSIFGSADQSSGVFKRLGQGILTEAVRNSDFVTRETQELLRQNPQAQEVLDKYDFYKTRIDDIKKHSTALKAHTDKLTAQMNAISDGELNKTIKTQIFQSLSKLYIASSSTNNLDSSTACVAMGGEISDSSSGSGAILTQLSQIVVGNSNKAIQDLTYELNATMFESEIIAKKSYEIVTGKEQPNFRYEDLKIADLKTPDLTFGSSTFGSSDIAMFLAGKVTPSELLLSLGSAKLAGELNLPKWSLKYAASAIDALTGDNDTDIKDAFFRAIGISSLEDQSQINSGSLAVSSSLGKPISIENLRKIVKDRQGTSQLAADALIAEILNLKGFNLSALMRGDFAGWSLARAKTDEFDQKNNLPTGTTEKFIKGSPLGLVDKSYISDDELRNIATKMKVSETAFKTFISIRQGNENPAINTIYYVDQNQYSANSGADTNIACPTKEIPAGSYVYYDQDGLHTFNSYALANEYAKAHKNRELNYLDEIANSIKFATYRVASTGGYDIQADLGNVKAGLESFLKSKDTQAFGEANFNKLASLMEVNFDVPWAIFTKVFARSTETGQIDQSAQVDFLKILGFHTLKYAAGDFLNDYLGISFGSSKITPDDLFEIMSGNGTKAFARIGGTLLDDEMDLDKGTIESILTSKTDDERKCSLENAALNLIGNTLGIHAMNLAGSLLNAFSGGRIETFLALPKGSFRGANLDELLKNVPGIDFGLTFRVPYDTDMIGTADWALRSINAETYDTNKDRSFYDKVKIIKSYVEGLGGVSASVNNSGDAGRVLEAYQIIEKKLKEIVISLSEDSTIFGSDQNVALDNLWQRQGFSSLNKNLVETMLESFLSRINSADSAFGLEAGSTALLFQNKLSADQYRGKVNNSTLTNGLGNFLIAKLGLEDTGITVASTDQFISAVRNMGGTNIWSPGNSGNRATVYTYLTDIFSINLDKKAGFFEGTLAKIIVYPNQAKGILLQSGMRKIDTSLKIQGQPYSLENIYSFFSTAGTNMNKLSPPTIPSLTTGSDEDTAACDNQQTTLYTECINSRRITGNPDSFRNGLATQASREIAKFITDITKVKVTVAGTSQTTDAYGITMPANDILGIARGDYRPLLLIGMVKGAGAVIGDANGRLAVGEPFVLNYQDYYTALYGNPALEDYARTRAYASTYAYVNGTNPLPPTGDVDRAGVANISAPPNAPSGVMKTPIPTSVDDESRIDVDNNYPVAEGANTAMPAYPGALPSAPGREEKSDEQYNGEYADYLKSLIDWTNKNALWANAVNSAYNAGEEAARSVKTIFQQNLKYKTMDAALYKLDNNIPAGFSRMMLNGNSYVKTTATLNYLENWVRNDVGWFENLPQGTFSALQGFFSSPNANIRGNLDALYQVAGKAGFGAIDTYLIEHSPKVMGVSLQPGTAEALFSFAMTGNIGVGYSFGGAQFKSFADVYGGPSVASVLGKWSDDKIGLPTGTTFGLYNSWKSIQSAQNALHAAEVASASATAIGATENIAKANEAVAKAKTSVASAKADAIAFAINMVFSKEVGQAEKALGLVPGTGAMLVTMLTQLAMGAVNPISLAIFIAINLVGVYKQEVICSADGSYPRIEDLPDPTKWDVAGLGEFNSADEKIRDTSFIAAAQYKAGQLVFDLLLMKDRTGDAEQVPVQIMTGRVEDVGPNVQLVKNSICDKVGSSNVQENTAVCAGWRSRSGLWANPQTTNWTHIGF